MPNPGDYFLSAIHSFLSSTFTAMSGGFLLNLHAEDVNPLIMGLSASCGNLITVNFSNI